VHTELTELLLSFSKNDRLAAFTEALQISIENSVTSIFQLDRKPFSINHDLYAGCQADEIVGVGQGIGFVEIIDAPTKTALDISPSAEAVYMEITDCQNFRRMAEIGAYAGPQLSPPVECASEKSKRTFSHLFMLQSKV
ncbi:MAG: hypothetical protein WB608_22650, partial [Terracidiphilus sp.]